MKIKTQDLEGDALKWAALTCEGWTDLRWKSWAGSRWSGSTPDGRLVMTSPSGTGHTNFDDLGLDVLDTMEWEKIGVLPPDGHRGSEYSAFHWSPSRHDLCFEDGVESRCRGRSIEEAVLRCYVTIRCGDEVEVPDVLAESQP